MEKYQEIISEALRKVVSEYGYRGAVQNRNIHEQALAHRLAYHLENSGYFAGYHIDCEYDRHGEDQKADAQGDTFRPDIVVHVRSIDDSNLIMIETKKFNDTKREINEAIEALGRRSQEYGYQHAFLVIFPEREANEDSVITI